MGVLCVFHIKTPPSLLLKGQGIKCSNKHGLLARTNISNSASPLLLGLKREGVFFLHHSSWDGVPEGVGTALLVRREEGEKKEKSVDMKGRKKKEMM